MAWRYAQKNYRPFTALCENSFGRLVIKTNADSITADNVITELTKALADHSVYNTVLGNMVDGFKECGSGWARTFRGGKKIVRIDYIFHDEALKGLSYYKSELTYSDHYPVFMKLSFK